jgi:hypothetical protein
MVGQPVSDDTDLRNRFSARNQLTHQIVAKFDLNRLSERSYNYST